MTQHSLWSPWTISDGLLTALADQWLVSFENGDGYVHADRLVKLGFSLVSAYGFVNDLRRNSYARSKDKTSRALGPYVIPTHNGINEFKIPINEEIERLKKLERKLDTKLTIELQRLEILRQTFDKIDAFLL